MSNSAFESDPRYRHRATGGNRKSLRAVVLALALLGTGTVTAGHSVEYADVVGQGPMGPVVAYEGAMLVRSENKLIITVSIPTPEPGNYNYPLGNAWNNDAYPGTPEAFSLWGFVFNYPELCTGGGPGVCTPADARNGTPGAGAFNVAGHLVAGPVLQLNGTITMESTPFGGAPLTNPLTAEVHVAIAPHGAVQPETLPNQIKTPIGDPSYWWLGRF
jgi:hypothetical protein